MPRLEKVNPHDAPTSTMYSTVHLPFRPLIVVVFVKYNYCIAVKHYLGRTDCYALVVRVVLLAVYFI